jgi:hypothetical protein
MHVLQARWGECSVIAAVAGPQDKPKTYTEPLVSEGCPVLWYATIDTYMLHLARTYLHVCQCDILT